MKHNDDWAQQETESKNRDAFNGDKRVAKMVHWPYFIDNNTNASNGNGSALDLEPKCS